MIPAQLVEQSRASDDDTLEAGRALADGHRGTG